MRPNASGYILIVFVILLTVYGQISIKWRINHLPAPPLNSFQSLLRPIYLLLDPVIFSGLMAALLAAIAWMSVLRKFDFGFAYPFMSLTFPAAIYVSSWLLGEVVSLQRTVGILLIMIGTVVAARG